MAQTHIPNTQTTLLVVLFAFVYMLGLLRKTARHQLDLYDVLMLSTVAVLPALLVLVPPISEWIAVVSGVLFPFVVMFGLLFVAIFMVLHRLTIKLHLLEDRNRLLIQELSLLQMECRMSQLGRPHSAAK